MKEEKRRIREERKKLKEKEIRKIEGNIDYTLKTHPMQRPDDGTLQQTGRLPAASGGNHECM